MKTFNIIKKNRKYFAAKIENYPCKILIDDNSENLELGEQLLEVDDISVRSSYGTDLIFKLSAHPDVIKSSGICTLRTLFYNKNLISECHKLGGKWDDEEKAWIFSGIVSDKVEELDEKYNSKMINVELTFESHMYSDKSPIYLAGFKIASAFGRDSDVKLAEGISLISGDILSGGSVKNWITFIKAGTVIRMAIPESLIKEIDSDVKIEII